MNILKHNFWLTNTWLSCFWWLTTWPTLEVEHILSDLSFLYCNEKQLHLLYSINTDSSNIMKNLTFWPCVCISLYKYHWDFGVESFFFFAWLKLGYWLKSTEHKPDFHPKDFQIPLWKHQQELPLKINYFTKLKWNLTQHSIEFSPLNKLPGTTAWMGALPFFPAKTSLRLQS